jgi:methylase of polypeptide subunit release factors
LIDISEDALAVAKKNYEYYIEKDQIDKSINVTLSQ